MDCPIEIHTSSGWRRIGTWTPDPGTTSRGIAAGGRWAYDMDWVLEHLDQPWMSASLALPLSLDSTRLSHWPAFLLDLLPAGPARERWLRWLDLRNGPGADWPLLQHAGRAPVGNLRLAHAGEWKPEAVRGFTYEKVLENAEGFLEFMQEAQQVQFGTRNDSPYSAADTQGAAPKYLLTQDSAGLWWAEGTLEEPQCRAFWLVKYPRGKHSLDRAILRAEAVCLEIARAWGLRCGEPLRWERDCLFVPRFDRLVTGTGIRRLGVESLCSSLGVAEFGHEFRHEDLCGAIARHSTDPVQDLLEHVSRDVLNIALANTDNHGRNTSFLKDGPTVRLSPLYDLAPMELDPTDIRRATRWSREGRSGPDWSHVANVLSKWMDRPRAVAHLRELAAQVRRLPDLVQAHGLSPEVVEHCRPRWQPLAESLEALD